MNDVLNHRTALSAAALGGHLEVVDWLLTQIDPADTAALRARDQNGAHAFDAAAQEGHLAVLQALFARDPGLLSLPGEGGRTALEAAQTAQHPAVVAWLLQQSAHRADPGETP